MKTRGNAKIKFANGATDIWTTHSITDYMGNMRGDINKRHCVCLDGAYHVPFRIDMTIRLDFPSFILFIGGGHITFGSLGMDNRKIEDIARPSGKPNQDHYSFDNRLPLGEFVDISIMYNPGEMQIKIGGEERFYSEKQAYMRAEKGDLSISLAVSKRATLSVKAITVTEFDGRAPIVRGGHKIAPANDERPHPTFEGILSDLPLPLRDEVIKTDDFLKSLRPLKFKRSLDKGGKISYVAPDFGVSYAIHVSGAQLTHHFGWYIVYNGKPETWHRKADYMEETLAEIAKTDPPLAARIFCALGDCIGCYGPGCPAKTVYTFDGQKRLSCHGRAVMRMCPEDFHDVRMFFQHANIRMAEKMASGVPLTGKILLQPQSCPKV